MVRADSVFYSRKVIGAGFVSRAPIAETRYTAFKNTPTRSLPG